MLPYSLYTLAKSLESDNYITISRVSLMLQTGCLIVTLYYHIHCYTLATSLESDYITISRVTLILQADCLIVTLCYHIHCYTLATSLESDNYITISRVTLILQADCLIVTLCYHIHCVILLQAWSLIITLPYPGFHSFYKLIA